jgi:hypothetical protein
MTQDISMLVAALPSLPVKDQGFASSLIAQHGKKGLTDKQWYWVAKLASTTSAPAVVATTVGDVSKIVELLTTAKQHLKRPAILVRANDRDLRLNIATSMAQVPGSINVCSTEKNPATDRNDWFGRITVSGEFQPSRKFDMNTQTAVANALIALANDPVQAAADYGHLTGSCCFCNKTLTDDRSVSVGYGPICAKHFGLPWGEIADAATLDV